MRRVVLLSVAATLAVACGADPLDDGEPRRGGGWDFNSGSWNGNMGTWGTIAGIGGNPPWAPDGTGVGTLTNYSAVGLRWTAPQATTPCGALTAGVDRVRFLSSTKNVDGEIGPDVELERGGERARLTMGEWVTFHGEALDGTMASIRVTIRLRRVDTLSHASTPSYEWPVFELELCEHARPDRGFAHLGYVSWGPMARLPESENGAFLFPADVVQPVTTLPRPEYKDNPDVPLVVAQQSGSLLFKFAFYASVPVALGDGADLAFTTSRGVNISNNQVLLRGAIALGNGAWVTMPGDPGNHQFLAFFTRTGTPTSMFALARGDGSGPAELKLPATWGRGTIPALQLTSAELVPSAAWSIDAVHAYVSGAMGAGDVWAHGPSELGHGQSTQRHGYYLGSSGNNLRMAFFAQMQASMERASWAGVVNGQVVSQAQLSQLMMLGGPGPTMLVAGESPPPAGKPAFESPPLRPMPDDSPVYADPPPVDAAEIDAPQPDATTDAPVDAGIDAPPDAMPDAPPDAMLDATMDASDPDASVPIDGPLMDAGHDALTPPDASAPPDAGIMDAPIVPPDSSMMPMCKAPGCIDASM